MLGINSSEHFGNRFKLGVREDSTNRTKAAELTRFHTPTPRDETISMKAYVGRMKDGQNDTHSITAESIVAGPPPPFLDTLRKKGMEARYMTGPVAESSRQQFTESDGRKLKSATKEGLDPEDGEEKKKLEELKALPDPFTSV